MDVKQQIIEYAEKNGKFKVADFLLSQQNQYSRQYISKIVNQLVGDNKLIKSGSTAGAIYALQNRADLFGNKVAIILSNKDLEEHKILERIEEQALFLRELDENVRSIFDYAFSEMLNNAIEHSKSERIGIEVDTKNGMLNFVIRDFGVGIFRNIMDQRSLKSELEAVQDLLKGKTTTAPQAHSGEGIFFTSKIADTFSLESYEYILTFDNNIKDIFFGKSQHRPKKGTTVTFSILLNSRKHLIDIFQKYQTSKEAMAFDKTEIQIKLYTLGTVHISRSQARRVLSGLERFKSIALDFDKVPIVGQGFADEIFRVFKNKHPEIKIEPINMNEAVEFMVKRVAKF